MQIIEDKDLDISGEDPADLHLFDIYSELSKRNSDKSHAVGTNLENWLTFVHGYDLAKTICEDTEYSVTAYANTGAFLLNGMGNVSIRGSELVFQNMMSLNDLLHLADHLEIQKYNDDTVEMIFTFWGLEEYEKCV